MSTIKLFDSTMYVLNSWYCAIVLCTKRYECVLDLRNLYGLRRIIEKRKFIYQFECERKYFARSRYQEL